MLVNTEDYSKMGIIALNLTSVESGYFLSESLEIGFKPLILKSFSEVISALMNKNYDVEFKCVLIGITDLYQNKEMTMHELINTVKNCCKMVNKPVPMISTWVRDDTINIEILRDIIKSDITSIFYLPNSTHESRIKRLKDYLHGNKVVDPEIHELANPKKTKNRIDSNQINLTTRQKQVLKLITERGASNKVIARTLKLSESTVKLHVGAILRKYNLSNRTQLALFSKPKKESKEDDSRVAKLLVNANSIKCYFDYTY